MDNVERTWRVFLLFLLWGCMAKGIRGKLSLTKIQTIGKSNCYWNKRRKINMPVYGASGTGMRERMCPSCVCVCTSGFCFVFTVINLYVWYGKILNFELEPQELATWCQTQNKMPSADNGIVNFVVLLVMGKILCKTFTFDRNYWQCNWEWRMRAGL